MIVRLPDSDVTFPWLWVETSRVFLTRQLALRAIYEAWKRAHPLPEDREGVP